MNFLICILLVKNFKFSQYYLWYQTTHIYAKKLNLLSRVSKRHKLESQFCELLRPQAPPFQKIERKFFLNIDLLKCLKITVVMLVDMHNVYKKR